MMLARAFRQENAMSEFPECLLIVTAEVDAAVEAEWNRWYDTVHMPDALAALGQVVGLSNAISNSNREIDPPGELANESLLLSARTRHGAVRIARDPAGTLI
jgi:hypothetical protein